MKQKRDYTNEFGYFSNFTHDVMIGVYYNKVDIELSQLTGVFDDELINIKYKIPKVISTKDAFNLF